MAEEGPVVQSQGKQPTDNHLLEEGKRHHLLLDFISHKTISTSVVEL